METVKIVDVKKNDRDWYEVTLEGDDRVLATQEEKLAEVASASIGGDPVEVEVNTRVKGKFTNHYIKSIGGVKGTPPATAGRPFVSTATAPRSTGRSQETQNDIAKQWALGRAVELLMASEIDFSYPVTEPILESLKSTAQTLLDARNDLKV